MNKKFQNSRTYILNDLRLGHNYRPSPNGPKEENSYRAKQHSYERGKVFNPVDFTVHFMMNNDLRTAIKTLMIVNKFINIINLTEL